MHFHEAYTLFLEEHSRYQERHPMAPLSDFPKDGLSRIIVDHRRISPREPRTPEQLKAENPRTEADLIAYLRTPPSPSTYKGVIGLVAARLAGLSGPLWCIGEMRWRLTGVFPRAAERDVAILRTSPSHGLFAFRIDPAEVVCNTVWPWFSSDYGGRIFAFDRQDTALEQRLAEFEAVLRRDSRAADQKWHMYEEQVAEAKRTGQDASLTLLGIEDYPESTQDARALWRALFDDCWYRDRLAALCQDAQFCVLPDIKHYGTVSFQSVRLSVTQMADALQTVVEEQGMSCERILNTGDEWRMLSDFDGFLRGKSRQPKTESETPGEASSGALF